MRTYKSLAVGSTALLLLGLIGFGISLYRNTQLMEKLNEERLESEALLAEKLLMEKAYEKNGELIDSLELFNKDLNQRFNKKTAIWSAQTQENIRIKRAL